MAGDSTECDALARYFEQNASRVLFRLDNIFEKYDREFPDDDVVDIRHSKILHNKGVVASMTSSKVGFATHRKRLQAKEGTPFNSTLVNHNDSRYVQDTSSVDDEQYNVSPRSEKSFISTNCSRWARDITEESEPSDAETITEGSCDGDSDSWEEEEEKSEAVSQSGSEDTDREPDWYFSDHVAEQGYEQRGNWLSIGKSRQELLKPQQRFHAERKGTRRKERTRTKHSSVHHKPAEKASFVPMQSAKPRHPASFSGQKKENNPHSNTKHSNVWGLAGGFTHNPSLTHRPLQDRIGPPRRLAPTRLFQNEENLERSSSTASSIIVLSSDSGEDLCGSSQQSSEEVNSWDGATGQGYSEMSNEEGLLSPLPAVSFQDEVDSFKPAHQLCEVVHFDSSLSKHKISTNTALLKDSRCAPDMRNGRSDNWIESYHKDDSGHGDRCLNKGKSLSDVAEHEDLMHIQVTGHKDVSEYQSPQFSRHLLNKTFIVPPSGSHGKTIFRSRKLKDQKQLSDRGDNSIIASCKHNSKKHNFKNFSETFRKDAIMETYLNRGQYSDLFSDTSTDTRLRQKSNITSYRASLQGSSLTCIPGETTVKQAGQLRNSAQSNGLSSESVSGSSSPQSEDVGTGLLELQRKLDFLTHNMSPKMSASNTPSKITDPKVRSGSSPNSGCSTGKYTTLGQHTPTADIRAVTRSPLKSNPNSSGKVAVKVDVKRESCSTLDANPTGSSILTPTDNDRVGSHSLLKVNPIVNISIGPASPLPLVKIESPQQWIEVKRKFRPTCEPVSTYEIKHVLEMPDSESVVKFLKQKYKTEPLSSPQETTQQEFQNSSQPPLQLETVTKSSSSSSKQLISAPKVKQQDIVRPAFTETEIHKLIPMKHDSPALTHFSSDKTERRASIHSPSPRLDRHGPERTTTGNKSPVGVGIFHASPGETFRQTITTPLQPRKASPSKMSGQISTPAPQALKEQSKGYLTPENSLVSTPVQPCVASVGKNKTSKHQLTSLSQPWFQDEFTKRSDVEFLQSVPFSAKSKSQHSPESCDHECTLGQEFESNIEQKGQKKLSGSAVQQMFTQLKQLSETKKTCRSLDHKKLSQQPHSRSATSLQEVQQNITSKILFGEKANLNLSEDEGSRKCGVSFPEKGQDDLLQWLSDLPPPQEVFLSSERKNNTTLSLLGELDTDKVKTFGDAHIFTEANRKSRHAVNTLPNFHFSQNMCRQQINPAAVSTNSLRQKSKSDSAWQREKQLTSDDRTSGTCGKSFQGLPCFGKSAESVETPAYMKHTNDSSQNSKDLRKLSSHPASTILACQHRLQPKLSTASEWLSPNPKAFASQNQSDTNQSLTPSKLIAELNLSEAHSPLNLTQNCDALSRLFLASSGGKEKKQSSDHVVRGHTVSSQDVDTSDTSQRQSFRIPVRKCLAEKLEEISRTEKHSPGRGGNYVQPTRDCTSKLRHASEPKTQTSKLSEPHELQLNGSKGLKHSSVKVLSSAKDTNVKKSSETGHPTNPSSEPKTQTSKLSEPHELQLNGSKGLKHSSVKVLSSAKDTNVKKSSETGHPTNPSIWKILKSRISKSQETVAVRSTASAASIIRASSPKTCASEGAGSKPLSCQGSKMTHINSPKRKLPQDHIFSFNSDHLSFSPAKRGFVFESNFDVVNEFTTTSSPHKRRRINSIGATSTPSRSNKPSPVKFNMDESLSTIAGDNNDLNGTFQSTEDGSIQEVYSSSSEEEDEITLISE